MVNTSLKKGDNVAVLTGKDAGKTGKVISVDRKTGKITVEGVNVRHRFEKPKGNKAGQKVSFPAQMHAGKVMLVCPECGKQTRIGYKILENGNKQRVCKKCQKSI
jgi:large subunit ribosomal protein L24